MFIDFLDTIIYEWLGLLYLYKGLKGWERWRDLRFLAYNRCRHLQSDKCLEVSHAWMVLKWYHCYRQPYAIEKERGATQMPPYWGFQSVALDAQAGSLCNKIAGIATPWYWGGQACREERVGLAIRYMTDEVRNTKAVVRDRYIQHSHWRL